MVRVSVNADPTFIIILQIGIVKMEFSVIQIGSFQLDVFICYMASSLKMFRFT